MKEFFTKLNEEFDLSSSNLHNYDMVKDDIFNELKIFFKNHDVLRDVISFDVIFNEYNTVKNVFTNCNFSIKLLHNLINYFNEAKNVSEDKIFKILGKNSIYITKGINNYSEIAILEQQKNIERLDLFSKICFKESADLIEGSIQPFIDLLYETHCLINFKNINPKTSFGSKINELIESNKSFVPLLTLPIEKNIGINITQLRNIAYHNSYIINDDKIICCYSNNKTFSLEKNDLLSIILFIHKIYMILKISHTFFTMDNIYSVRQHFNKNIKITEDTINITVSEFSHLHGFKIEKIKKGNIYEVKLLEIKRYENFNNNLNQLVLKIATFLNKETVFDITPIFDKPKIKLRVK
ncbi:hypothetical protein [Aliarcobacter cryaerophilus]|uniref:Uncharacterized protein n=1 Tax=Aliarcobacter cryaerophilus TaxID=28198 RepID=A0AA46NEC5_9BACT|nr:hypothetical protein [Aliarcobacter cryaerophilus]UYF43442.1 hypothetical protein NGX11_00515 [Aliarcobacter cryaerophilus]